MRARLKRNVAANVANAVSGIGAALITTPLIIDRVGTAGYGVWTIALSFILFLAIAEAGFGPAAQRFVAVAHGRGDLRPASRILWTTLGLYLAVGAVGASALAAAAGPIVSVFDFPASLDAEARDLLRLVGVAVVLALASTAASNVQAGLERFVPLAGITVAGSLVYLALIVVLVVGDAELAQLGYAVLAQQALMLALRLFDLRAVVSAERPGLVTRQELRELVTFSAKLQVTVLSILINGQSDKIVVGLVAPAATVGQLGVAVQLAEAGRLVGSAALLPLISRLSAVRGRDDEGALHREFQRLNSIWLLVVLGATIVGLAAVYPLVRGWLGEGYGEAILFGEFLVAAYAFSLLGGTRMAYLRAINRVGLEAWTGAVTVGLNIALTIPLALAFGPLGVVCATLAAYGIGLAWFVVRFNEYAPPVPALAPRALAQAGALGVVAGAATLGWGALMVEALAPGVALVPVLLGTATAFAAYVAVVTRVRPTPSGLAELVGVR